LSILKSAGAHGTSPRTLTDYAQATSSHAILQRNARPIFFNLRYYDGRLRDAATSMNK
jgi:hypothetical protein